MDADGSHDPAALPALLAALDAGAGVAVGSRYVTGGAIAHWPPWRRALSRGGCAYAREVLRVPVRDLTSGMKAWRAPALAATRFADVHGRGYAFQVELTYRALLAGVPVTEVPITFTERRAGASKLSGAIALEAAWRVPALRLQSRRVLADLRGDERRATRRGPRMGRHPRHAARLARAPAPRRRRLGAARAR